MTGQLTEIEFAGHALAWDQRHEPIRCICGLVAGVAQPIDSTCTTTWHCPSGAIIGTLIVGTGPALDLGIVRDWLEQHPDEQTFTEEFR